MRYSLRVGVAIAAALTLGIAASPAAADQTINVPCGGSPVTSGPNGLVAAINAANAYGASHPGQKTTINIVNNCAYDFSKPNNFDDGANAVPVITSTIAIKGQSGPDEPAIIMRSVASGTSAFRLIEVASNGRLTLNSVEVTNGLTPNGADGGSGIGDQNGAPAPNGGGILSRGALTLQDSVVSGNLTGNGGNGGNSTSGGNANGGNGGDGGGIYVGGGTLTINGGDNVSGNATGNGGNGGDTSAPGSANGGSGGNGGGIATGNGSDNLQDHTTLDSNSTGNGGGGGTSAGGSANGGNGGNGGSSYSAGGTSVTISGGNSSVDVSDTGIGGNGGTGSVSGPGNSGDGGGVFTSGVLSTNDTKFTESVAGSGEQDTSGFAKGGGLAVENGGKAQIHNGSFTWNVANTGGAVYHDGASTVSVTGTKFANNTPNNCTPSGGGCPA